MSTYCSYYGEATIDISVKSLQLLKQNGLLMEVYPGDTKEHYDIEYVEVMVTETHP